MTEIEVKLLDIDLGEVRSKLAKLGATKVFDERLFRRVVLVDKDQKMEQENAFLRIRDEGDKIQLSYKRVDSTTIDGTKEFSITVDDFDKTRELLNILGFKEIYYQETKREEWKLADVLFDIDIWPGLNPYLEIEAGTKGDVEKYTSLLGLQDKEKSYARIGTIYLKAFGRDVINEFPILTFETQI